MRTRIARDSVKWSEHSKDLPPLRVGDHVLVQNQHGPYPTRWDRRGVVIEVLQHHQYRVRLDGSRTPTLRNRRFLRRFLPFSPTPAGQVASEDRVSPPHPLRTNEDSRDTTPISLRVPPGIQIPASPEPEPDTPQCNQEAPVVVPTPHGPSPTVPEPQQPRRSSRTTSTKSPGFYGQFYQINGVPVLHLIPAL